MKKQRGLREKHMPPLKLFLEDLLEIYNNMAMLGDVSITAGEYSFESIEDLKKNAPCYLKDLSFTVGTFDCSFYLGLSNRIQWMEKKGDDVKQRAVAATIEDVCNKRVRPILRLWDAIFGYVMAVFSFVFPALLFYLGRDLVFVESEINYVRAFGLFSFATVIMFFIVGKSFKMMRGGLSVAVLKKESETQGLLQRNKDQIMLIIFSCILTAATTFVITFYFTLNK